MNLFFIDYAWCKLWTIWLPFSENNSRIIIMQKLNTGGKKLMQLLIKMGLYMTISKGKLQTEPWILVDYSY